MVYELMLFDEKVKPHHVTTLHLLSAIAFICTGLIIAVYNYTIPGWGIAILCFGFLILGLTIVKNKWLISKNINVAARLAELSVSISIAVLSAVQHWKFPFGIFCVLSLVLLFGILWERTAGTPLFVQVDDRGLKLPVTARGKVIPWTEIEEVVYRFGILTVDCTNNNLFQWNIKKADVNQESFMAWCNAKVEEHKPNRAKNDW